MTHTMLINGWERLPNGFDVQFVHNIPVKLSDNGIESDVSKQVLAEEISALGELHVEIGDWVIGEKPDEHEAPLFVSTHQIKEVLHRLALSSAALFYDRYKKPISKRAVDWDEQEYHKDFGEALKDCGLDWGDLKQSKYHDYYIDTMHEETKRLAGLKDPPFVEPE